MQRSQSAVSVPVALSERGTHPEHSARDLIPLGSYGPALRPLLIRLCTHYSCVGRGVRPRGEYCPGVAYSAVRAQYRSLLLSLSGGRTLGIVPATLDHWGATALPSDLLCMLSCGGPGVPPPGVACSAVRAQYRSLLLSLSGARTPRTVPATPAHWGATAPPSDLFSYGFAPSPGSGVQWRVPKEGCH